MGRALGLGILLAALWLSLSGHYTPLILSFGAGSEALVVFLARRMDLADHEGVPLNSWSRFIRYLPWLLKEIFVANWVVAKLILDPKLSISPMMVQFKGTQKSDVGRFLYANSITLTPGTITTGIHDNDFEIHALTSESVDGSEENKMNRLCTWVEGAAE